MTVGNYNTTLHFAGLDRQFRGRLRALDVSGSRLAQSGALTVQEMRGIQSEISPGRWRGSPRDAKAVPWTDTCVGYAMAYQ